MSATTQQLWSQCLDIIRDNVSPEVFSTWFEPIEALRLESGKFYIVVPSQFFVEYLEAKYAELLQATIHRVFGKDIRLMYRVIIDRNNKRGGSTDLPAPDTKPTKKSSLPEFDSHLNIRFTFSNFVEGECNKLPRTAGINIASQPGKSVFNPLLIYGRSGVGKTHLVNAIGMKAKELHPQKKVLYVSANLFQLQYTDAVRHNQVNDFINFYRMVDVLIIDDIHELGEGNKTATQNAFFHIFNHLRDSGKQLILTCDRKPAELEGVEDRLLTRFKSGLTAELETPDLETRKAILHTKVEADGLRIPENVLDYLAEHITDSIRHLEGALISVMAQSTMTGRTINLDLTKKVVGNLVSVVEHQLSVQDIREVVCNHYRISEESLLSASRKREIVQARQVAMYFAKKLTKDSLSSIGSAIGKRNHATVLHACKTVGDLIDTDKSFRRDVEDIERKLQS